MAVHAWKSITVTSGGGGSSAESSDGHDGVSSNRSATYTLSAPDWFMRAAIIGALILIGIPIALFTMAAIVVIAVLAVIWFGIVVLRNRLGRMMTGITGRDGAGRRNVRLIDPDRSNHEADRAESP